MVRVVNSLFADYLEPRGLVDPRQTLLTGEQTTTTEPTITPIVQPLTAPTPTMIVDPIGYQDPAATAFDPSMIDLDALANLDLSGLEGLNLELDISNMYMPKPTDFGSFFNEYSDFLSSVASGNTSSKVNRNDDIYNNFISSKGDLFFEGTPEELRASAGLSDVFALYDDPAAQITSQSVQPIYQSLMTAEDPLALLSDYYGFEITPAQNEGSIYNNATRYGTTADKMAEFQSIIEPILQKAIPYIQATQGLEYTDALEYAYTHDPMIASLYAKYDMDLYRQTKDGSTYIYDPIAGAEIRTLEVKDPKFKDIAPALAGLALSFTGIPGALGTALGVGGTQAATALGSALISGATTLVQGGDLEDALKSAITSGITAGVSGGLEEAVAKALGVSEDVAAGITAAGLTAAQGGNTEDALLSGFLAGASSYIQGELPSGAEWDAEKGALVGKDGQVIGQQPDFVVGGADSAAGSAAAWSQVLDSISNVDTQAVTATETPEIFAGRTTGEATADTTVDTSGGGMLTADTPAGAVEEVVVTPSNDVLYTVPTAEGAIIQTAEGLLPNAEGERWFKIIQEQDPAFYEEMVSAIEQYGTDLGFKWKGIPLNVSDWFGGTTTRQAPERVVEPTQGDTAVEQITPEDAIQPEQPPLPPADETLDIPEVDIENLPPEVDVTPVVTPPTPPETPQVTTPVTGGGGGAPAGGGAAGGVGVPQVPTIPTDAGGAQGDAPEVADVFGDTTLEGDAFGDTVTGGADGGAAAEGGDAGTVDVTTTEQYQNLQAELDNALASQSTLEIEVDNLQNEVDAANAALAEAEAAAEAAAAAGAANADELRGEVVAAQATADSLQGQLNSANEALGNANSTIEGLQGELAGTTGRLNEALDSVESLSGQLTEATNNVNALSYQLSTAQGELASLQSEYEAAQEANADTVDELAKEISDKEGEISDLESELSGANATIGDLEAALAASQAATETAIAEGVAAAEAAGEAGYETGYGTGAGAGVGAGTGLGSLLGLLGGFSVAQGQQPVAAYTPTQAKDFTAELNFRPPTAERLQQKQLQDYVGMLLGNMR